jgi:acetolactate synthase small subunit
MSPFAATLSAVDPQTTTCFSVTARLEPGILPRVLDLFAKRGLTPSYCCSRAAGREMSIDLQVRGLDPDIASHIAACFRQMPSVGTVLTCVRG